MKLFLIPISVDFVPKCQQIINIKIDDDLVTGKVQAIIWTNIRSVHWRINASLSLNEFNKFQYLQKYGTTQHSIA